ncbi:M28 family peptidase [Comamonas sp. J-3]
MLMKRPTQLSAAARHLQRGGILPLALVLAALLGLGAGAGLMVQPGVEAQPAPLVLLEAPQLRASPERLQAHVRALSEDIPGRSFDQPAQLQKAADYIYEQFQALGVQPQRQPVLFDGKPLFQNIVLRIGPTAGQPGGDAPLLVIGAHFDTIRTNGVSPGGKPDANSHTPGADDNASGVAGLLELARLLTELPPKQPIELVAYTLEEPPQFRTPLMGSFVHASQLAQQGVPLRLMLSLEMIGYFDDKPGSQHYPVPGMTAVYPDTGNFLALIGQMRHFGSMRDTKAQMLGAADLNPVGRPALPIYTFNAPTALRGIDYSDHQNYWWFGFPAIMVTDTSFMRNPHYHRSTDTWDKLDYQRMAQVVNAVLTVAHAAPASAASGVVAEHHNKPE